MTNANTISERAKILFILLSSVEACKNSRQFLKAGAALISFARRAYTVCDFEAVQKIGKALSDSPYAELFQGVGDYFLALGSQGLGQGDLAVALRHYRRAAANGNSALRASALVGAGHASRLTGALADARYLYTEAEALSVRDRTLRPATLLQIAKGRAIMSAMEGDKRGSLSLLKSGRSLVGSVFGAEPRSVYDFCNSYAVGLAACGEFAEARSVIRPVIASPYAPYHPQWHDTLAEIEAMDPPAPTGRVYMPSDCWILPDNVFELKTHARQPAAETQPSEDDQYREDIDASAQWEREHARDARLRKTFAPTMKQIRSLQRQADREVTGGTNDSEAG